MSLVALVGAVVVSLASLDDPAPRGRDDIRAGYEKARAETPRDAASQVKLALWCESHGLMKEKARHLAMAALADPGYTLARSLMGLVRDGDAWRPAEEVARRAGDDPARVALLADYRARREAMKDAANDHGKLAQWCESKGLADEAQAHWRAVVRLDPTRDLAWKKLGCKKVDGEWFTDAQLRDLKADREAQKAADQRWEKRLAAWKADLRSKDADRRAAADRELADVADHRAVPTILRAFLFGKDADPARAVQLLGQIDAPSSSRALAWIAVAHNDAVVRARSAEALRFRDAREFAGLLVPLLQDPIKYEVRPVGGPGSPGGLFIQGDDRNLVRRYTPPSGPVLLPGDRVGVDDDGRVVADRQIGIYNSPLYRFTGLKTGDANTPVRGARVSFSSGLIPIPLTDDFTIQVEAPSTQAFSAFLAHNGMSGARAGEIVSSLEAGFGQSTPLGAFSTFAYNSTNARPQGPTTRFQYTAPVMARVPIEQLQAEAWRAAVAAQEQLKNDAAMLDRENEARRERNGRVLRVLRSAGAENAREERAAWVAWYTDLVGYAYIPEVIRSRETIYEDVPLVYEPGPVPIPVYQGLPISIIRMSCFAAGTGVHTMDGIRPIESLDVGDRVLTQDPASGTIAYKPVLIVHRNPPNATLDIRVGEETIRASNFHRFWVAGRGWVMARELKPGDTIRTLRGTAPVVSVAPGETVPVFNLDVADAATFFVGDSALLVHDNTLPDFRARPFDSAEIAGR